MKLLFDQNLSPKLVKRQAAIALGLQEWFSEEAHFAQLPDAVAAFEAEAKGDAAH
jgi:hypothetical protein